MRKILDEQQELFHTFNIEDLIPPNHPIRSIKKLVDKILRGISSEFDKYYSDRGRKSIPPEWLIKAKLYMALFTVRSERQFCEQMAYNFMIRWFLDMTPSEKPFDHSSFSKNLDRILNLELSKKIFYQVVREAKSKNYLSEEHFTVDGSLIEAWASHKSFRPKDGSDDDSNDGENFHGQKRKNDTHQSTTDPEAKLFRKGSGKQAILCYLSNILTENRNGLVVDVSFSQSVGTTESIEADKMLQKLRRRGFNPKTIGADKGYYNKKLIQSVLRKNIKPHIAEIESRVIEGIDGRTINSKGYKISQTKRKKVEEVFGWIKTVGNYRKTRHKSLLKNEIQSHFVFAAYNLRRMATLACL